MSRPIHRKIVRARLRIEALEARRCLAASVTNIGNFNETDPYIFVRDTKVVGDDIYFSDAGGLYRSDSATGVAVALTELGNVGTNLQLTEFNGNVYFQGFDDTNRFELWRTDGTAAGTTMVKNLSNNTNDFTISSLTVFNDHLYFVSEGNLYSTDGTADGTTQLVDILPGTTDGVANLMSHNSALYFSAQSKLYKSDGTSSGTGQVPNSPTGGYALLTSLPGSLYFNANQLWRLDDATQQFFQIGPLANSIVENSGSVYFSNITSLWKVNGTVDGSLEVSVPGGEVSNLVSFQGKLYFSAGEDVYGPGTELWSSDGTGPATSMLKDVEPRQWFYHADWVGDGSRPSHFTELNGQLYFVTESTASGSPVTGLWKTDGTVDGTVQVHQGAIHGFTRGANEIVFGAATATGEKLLRLDLAGQVTEVPRGGTGTGSFGSNNSATVNGQQLLFGNIGALGNELYRLNNDNTLTLLKDITPGAASTSVAGSGLAGNLFYFVANGSLYRTDGTAVGTFALMPFTRLDAITVAGSQIFIAGEQAGVGAELWKTDGTVAGTSLVKDIIAGSESSNPRELIEFNGKLYFTAVSAGKRTIWVSDGTAAGTKSAINLAVFDSTWLRVFQNQIYFTTLVGNNHRIYRTNGTQTGTTTLADFVSVGDTNQVAVLGNTLYFAARTSAYGFELWKSVNGQPPQLVKDIQPGVNWSSPTNFTVFNNKLYFTAFKQGLAQELWETSGTAATTRAFDIYPGGSDGSSPTMLGELGGVMFFAATDIEHGRELWQINSTGVSLVQDILPGRQGSFPNTMLIRGQDAVFSAYSRALGFELWRVRSAAPVMTLPAVSAKEFREGAGAVRLAPAALLEDSDNALLAGGRLSVSLGSSFRAGDQVLLGVSSSIQLNGSTVVALGTAIGTLSSSGGGRDLRVDFNQNATRALVREVLRAVAFNHTTSSPVPGQRSVRFDLSDGSSGQGTGVVRINVVPLDTLPVISGLPASISSTLNSPGVAFAAAAVVTDDNFNMAGGELTVHFNNSRDYTRVLISLSGQFTKDSQNRVYRGAVLIGTMNASGGVGATPLRITFNDKVTPAIAQELLRSLKLSTPGSTTAGVRIPWIRISDGSRGFSEPVTRPYINITA